jgi:hypothetical protein
MCHPSDVPGQEPGDEVVEAVAELRGDSSADALTGWCAERDIRVLPMTAGVLLTAPRQQLLESFGGQMSGSYPLHTLPVPPELRATVRSITVMAPPSLHSPDR